MISLVGNFEQYDSDCIESDAKEDLDSSEFEVSHTVYGEIALKAIHLAK